MDIGNRIHLHYVERGSGEPVIFIHGSLSDYTYWQDELTFFANHYRAIAYSRRYDFPNHNAPRRGYSAVADAGDLARFVRELGLGRVHVVGHSYGALTGLFFASHHPDLLRSLVLAEPPAIPLLGHITGEQASLGAAMLADIEEHLVPPLRRAFRTGDREGGIRLFLGYVRKDPQAWDRFSAQSKAEILRNAREWDVILSRGTLFPQIAPDTIRQIQTPTLLLSGAKSYPFLNLIDEELARLLPHSHRIILEGATHQMWYERTAACREATLDLLRRSSETTAD